MDDYNILTKSGKTRTFDKGILTILVKGKNYRHFVESYIDDGLNRKYYICLSDKKFNENCGACKVDNYGRCKIKLKEQELIDYLNFKASPICVTFYEHTDQFDSFLIE